jgi:hypothetical protein
VIARGSPYAIPKSTLTANLFPKPLIAFHNASRLLEQMQIPSQTTEEKGKKKVEMRKNENQSSDDDTFGNGARNNGLCRSRFLQSPNSIRLYR